MKVKKELFTGVNYLYILFSSFIDIFIYLFLSAIDYILVFITEKRINKKYSFKIKKAFLNIAYIGTRGLKDILISLLFILLTLIIIPILVNLFSGFLQVDTNHDEITKKLDNIHFSTSNFYRIGSKDNSKSFIFYFDNAISTVDTKYSNNRNQKELNEILKHIKENKKYIITIVGHASRARIKKDHNNYENNYELSFARALNSKKILLENIRGKNINIRFILSAVGTEKSEKPENDNEMLSRKTEITIFNWESTPFDGKEELSLFGKIEKTLENIKKTIKGE